MIVYGQKSKLKLMRYQKNSETLVKSSLYFSRKLTVFDPASRNKLYQLGKNWKKRGWTFLKNKVLANFHRKGLTISAPD